MTILMQIIHDLIAATQPHFHTEGLRIWCQNPARVADPAWPNRVAELHCFVSQVTGLAHPAALPRR
jgi:hypothetical protein